ncbi:MAG: hypothetical protein NT060_00855 [Candidatus Omnitrophica bacterium]|nr:hypothetical protein [Candidatus Omnitrophota bacterium]
MNSNKTTVKKLITREGLILLGVLLLGLGIYFIARNLNTAYIAAHPEAKFKYVQNMQYILVGYTPYIRAMSLGLNIAMLGYPVLAIARFILWAVRMLSGRKTKQ